MAEQCLAAIHKTKEKKFPSNNLGNMVRCNKWNLNKHPCFIVNFSLVKFFDKYTFFQFTMNFYKPLVCLKLYGECERPSPNKMGLIEIQFEFIMV